MNALSTAITALVFFALLGLVLALPTMWLWDWLMPELFGLKEITLLQAIGINLLCATLFKSSASTSK